MCSWEDAIYFSWCISQPTPFSQSLEKMMMTDRFIEHFYSSHAAACLHVTLNRKNELMRWGLASAHFYRRRNWGIERERNLPKAIRRTKNLVLTHCKVAFNTSGFLPFSPPSPHFSFLHLFVVQVFHGDFGKVSIRYGPSFFISQNPIWRQISSVIWAERISYIMLYEVVSCVDERAHRGL